MSGTSLDGVDAVQVDFSTNTPSLIAKQYLPFDSTLRQQLLQLHHPQHDELHTCQLVANQLARLYAQCVHQLLQQTDTPASQISAIGCHGQTIRHRPECGYTVQIGNAALLAELSGITVINDFRSRDIAAGGQGAPLVPAFHDCILRHPTIHRVIVNIGGISNLTKLAPDQLTIGFDCGPGNLLMDSWCQQHIGQSFDADGNWAATGQVIPELLKLLLSEPYFSASPPKSTGRDLFNMSWLTDKLSGNERNADVQATLLELTCISIADAITQHCIDAQEIYVCGGGARNRRLMQRLQHLLPIPVATTNELGVDSDYLEAYAFAWLAQQTLARQTANLPHVTGAAHPCVLGAVYYA